MIYELSNTAEDPHAGAASAVVPGLGAAVKGGGFGGDSGELPRPHLCGALWGQHHFQKAPLSETTRKNEKAVLWVSWGWHASGSASSLLPVWVLFVCF